MTIERRREIQRKADAKWYRANRSARLAANKRCKDKNRAWFRDQRSRMKCAKCGEDHPAVLDLHHLNPLEKDFNLGEAGHRGFSIENMAKEMAKCIVLCSNCHRKLHWIE